MKLVMTLCVKNEADIVRENIEFHLNAGVDFIIATDNCSDDATESILKEYERAGVLRYLFAPSPFLDQAKLVTKMARMAYLEYDADWVINNDADEFWWTPDGNLKATIQRYCDRETTDALYVNRVDFVSDSQNESQDLPFYQYMTQRKLESLNSLLKPLPPKLMHRADPKVKVGVGNHNANGKLITHKVVAQDSEIVIFHFPLRSYQQLVRKATKDYQARLKNISFGRADSTYAEYHRLYNEGQLMAYYESYCSNKEDSVVSDFRFTESMKKIMNTPLIRKTSLVYADNTVGQKLKKRFLMNASLLSEYISFSLKKCLYQLRLRLNRS